MLGWLQDLRYGARTLRRQPGTTALIVLVLALGIGAGTALFSIFDSVVLRPLPGNPEPQRVKLIRVDLRTGGLYGVPYHHFHEWRQSPVFESITAIGGESFRLQAGGEVVRLRATVVDPAYFDTLGLWPAIGQPFTERGEPGVPPSRVLLSHDLWRRHFGADPDLVGGTIRLDGRAVVVQGVMPDLPEIPALGIADLWVPTAVNEAAALVVPVHGFAVLGRLAPGRTLEQAQADLDARAAAAAQERPDFFLGWGVQVVGAEEWVVENADQALLRVGGLVALVLVLACVNVAGLQLARAPLRRRELAVRRALGASRGRLLRQLLGESLLLSTAGGALGALLAMAAVATVQAWSPRALPRLETATVDGRVLAVALGVTLAVGLAAGIVPALGLSKGRSMPNSQGLGDGRRGGRLQSALITAEVAIALAGLIAAGLLIHSWIRLDRVEPGFAAADLTTLRFEMGEGIELGEGGADAKQERIATLRALLEELRALPGMRAAAASGGRLPLEGGQGVFELYLGDGPREPGHEIRAVALPVSPGYLEAMGIELVAGRRFRSDETWESDHAVILNRRAAERFWPGETAVGREIVFRNGESARVVGVSADVRQLRLEDEPALAVYIAWGMTPARQALVLRSDLPTSAVLAAARPVIRRHLPEAPIYEARAAGALLRDSLASRRLVLRLASLFAALALVLVVAGVYGVAAYQVSRRRSEIGLRMALGAAPRRILAQALSRGARPLVSGLLLGAFAGFVVSRWLAALLFEISPSDPWVFGGAIILLAAAALLAIYLPARRASRVDPIVALRAD